MIKILAKNSRCFYFAKKFKNNFKNILIFCNSIYVITSWNFAEEELAEMISNSLSNINMNKLAQKSAQN